MASELSGTTSTPSGKHKSPSARRPKLFTFAAVLVVAWLAVGGVGGPLFGKLEEVQQNDSAAFLPSSAESTRAQELLATFDTSGAADVLPLTIAFEKGAPGFTDAEIGQLIGVVLKASTSGEAAKVVKQVAVNGMAVPAVFPATPEQAVSALSKDREAFVAVVNLDSQKIEDLGGFAEVPLVVDEISAQVSEPLPNVRGYVTGPAGFFAELGRAFAGIDGRLLQITLAVVAVILLLVYRSPFLWIFPLMSSVFALSGAIIGVYYLAKAGWLDLNGQSQGIMFVLVLGAATDYALLLVARYREELTKHESKYTAMGQALRASWEPIVASAGTVIAGLMCLLLSDLSSNASLGPVSAIGIVFAVIASLTFLPAVLVLFGRFLFWPFVPRYGSEIAEARGVWAKVARGVGRRPRRSWLMVTALLVVAAAFVPTLRAEGLSTADTFTNKNNPAVVGLRVLEKHNLVPPTPDATIVVSAAKADAVRQSARDVGDVAIAEVRQTQDGTQALVVNGLALVDVTFSNTISNSEKLAALGVVRAEVKRADPTALVGGDTAIDFDVQKASRHDRNLIIPVALLVITIILMLLLRSILAPLLLLGTVVLSFASALGISALLFNHVFDFAGADTSFPLFAFVFLVALGIDYNIFLMTRVREESKRMGTRPGVLVGLAVTGGVITSAGIVLAATFSALAVIPIVFLAQVGLTVSLGVLLDTLLVRSILVPALVHDIGKNVWWPSRLAKADA